MGLSATELRIGNWVMGDTGKPFQIELSDFLDWWNDHNSHEYGDHIHPIPLTEDWLLKVKWKYHDWDVNRTDRKKERFYISPFFGEHREYWIELQLSNNSFGHSFMWLCWDIGGGKDHIHLPMGHKMDYVHQLQNLYFALTGEELKS